MKSLSASLALILFGTALFNPSARADTYLATLETGGVADILADTPVAGGEVFAYTNTDVGLLGPGGVLSESTSVFTATYLDVTGTLGVLNVNDVCTSIDILGPATPCQGFAFSFTDLTLGDASVVVDLNAVASVDADVADLDIASGSIAGGSGTFNFSCPPASATPEPGSLCLLATGLLATAGAVRQRMMGATCHQKEVPITA